MSSQSPQFPYNDAHVKVIALVGYTGVGKTSLITAGYFENIMHGKDAFTQRFFQRIENQIRIFGEIPLTLGEAATLNFIEPKSRNEFTIQDFSGEHIKLDRIEREEYHKLISRADNSNALLCLLSASNFYKTTQIYEEVDAIQTFVNKLRGLGTRIPVAIILTKSDTVPRFYLNLPILKNILNFISKLPFLSLPPSKGLQVTMHRFPNIFKGFNFEGKGPRPIFMGIAIPRLKKLKPWKWPKGIQWLAKILRTLLIDPQWIFKSNYQLINPLNFGFQAFQLSLLRDLLVKNHNSKENCQKILEKFSNDVIDSEKYGAFYFKDYFDRILQDTQSLIEEMEKEIETLQKQASQLLSTEKNLSQNLGLWLIQIEQSISKFNKPWSQGASESVKKLRYDTLKSVKEKLQEKISQTLQNKNTNVFYDNVELLKQHKQLSRFDIWQKFEINLPEIDIIEKVLFENLLHLVLSQTNDVLNTLFIDLKNKYIENSSSTPPLELNILEKLIEFSSDLQKKSRQYEIGTGKWGNDILPIFLQFYGEWRQLTTKFELPQENIFVESCEKKALQILKKESEQFQSLSQILEWITELEQLVLSKSSKTMLEEISAIAYNQSQKLLQKELNELQTRSEKYHGSGKLLPQRLKEWFNETEKKQEIIKKIAGFKGLEKLESLQKTLLKNIADFLENDIRKTLEEKQHHGTFLQLIEILHIYKDIEKTELFSKHGITLPATEELEKELFSHLVLMIVNHNGINNTIYEKEKIRFLSAIRGSAPPLLESLDNLIKNYDKIQKISKNTASLKLNEWKSKLLEPMHVFHESWTELASNIEISTKINIREEIESTIIRALQEKISELKLYQLREWIKKLSPLLLSEENHNLLDKILKENENNIRNRFQKDLQEFIEKCQDLKAGSENLQKKEQNQYQEVWYKFTGSVSALEYSTNKFPKTELSFGEETQKLLIDSGPKEVNCALEKWSHELNKKKLLKTKQCKEIISIIVRIRNIFERPQAFSSISEYIQNTLKILKRKLRQKILATSLILMLLTASGTFLYLRYSIKYRIINIQTFASNNFEKHKEIAKKWNKLLILPIFLFDIKDYDLASKNLRLHKQMEILNQIHNRVIEKKVKPDEFAKYQKRINSLLSAKPDEKIQLKGRIILLELQALQLLDTGKKMKNKTEYDKQIGNLVKLEKKLKQKEPFFKSYILEQALKK